MCVITVEYHRIFSKHINMYSYIKYIYCHAVSFLHQFLYFANDERVHLHRELACHVIHVDVIFACNNNLFLISKKLKSYRKYVNEDFEGEQLHLRLLKEKVYISSTLHL